VRPIAPLRDWLTPFEPAPWLAGGHAQTLAGNYWQRAPFQLPSESEPVLVDPADGSRVLCHTDWQPESLRSSRLTLLLLHGLEGSSASRYICGIAARAWALGCNVIRMNMRNCGGTEEWTPTLYHSGLSGDVAAVLRHFAARFDLQRVAVVGYSMGGNLVLKLAGELGFDAPAWLTAAVAVSPAADLAPSADALHQPSNRLYEWNFLRNLMRRFERKAALFPEIYAHPNIGPIRSIRDFDDRITARFSGFSSADDYYNRSAAARVVAQIAIPTLVIHAADDPFIRLTPQTQDRMRRNPHIHLLETDHGGHCAFLARKSPSGKHSLPPNSFPAGLEFPGDRHWAEATLLRFLFTTVGHADGG
jgi:predicted alpha/beta-fold hydrolase